MPVAAVFSSHSPLKDYREPPGQVAAEVDTVISNVRAAVANFAPDLVICFAPDHFNGFFYRLMPSFCIGTAAESVGDWRTPGGALPVASDIAADCVNYLHNHDVDISISHRMDVDHGATQLLTQLFDWQLLPDILPIFVNCAAPPLPPIKRVVALGKCVGEFLKQLDERNPCRILITASGGLSHDPPIPQLASAPEPVRERLIAGGPLSVDARAARQEKILSDADAQVSSTSSQRELNPEWDKAFLDMLLAAEFGPLAVASEQDITQAAGCGGHEVRTWVAAASALRSFGNPDLSVSFYQAIPAWVAGFGIATAGLATAEG